MATSDVQICSNALLLLGAEPISSFTEESENTGALLCANLWDTVRQSVLRSHPWNCATKRVVLAPETTAPAYDWGYSFLLPGDWLRTLSVGQIGESIEYQTEDNRILMDDAVCYLRYVFDQEDVPKYDSMLALAMTSAMAATLAYPITKSASQQEAMVKLHEFHLKRARAVNGQEDTPEEFGDFPVLSARF